MDQEQTSSYKSNLTANFLSNEDSLLTKGEDWQIVPNQDNVPAFISKIVMNQQQPQTNLQVRNPAQLQNSTKAKAKQLVQGLTEEGYVRFKFSRSTFFKEFFYEFICLLCGPFGILYKDWYLGHQFQQLSNAIVHMTIWVFFILGIRAWMNQGAVFNEEVIQYLVVYFWPFYLYLIQRSAEVSTFDKAMYLTKRNYFMKKNPAIMQLKKQYKLTKFEIELDQKIELVLLKLKIDPQLFHIQFDTQLTQAQKKALKHESKSEQLNHTFDGKGKSKKKQTKSSTQKQLENKIAKGRYSGKSICKYIIRNEIKTLEYKQKIITGHFLTWTFVGIPITAYALFFCYNIFYHGQYIQPSKDLGFVQRTANNTNMELIKINLSVTDYILYCLMLVGGIVTQYYYFQAVKNNLFAMLIHNKTQQYFQSCLDFNDHERTNLLPSFNFFDPITVDSFNTMRKVFLGFANVELQQLEIVISGMACFLVMFAFSLFQDIKITATSPLVQQSGTYEQLTYLIFGLVGFMLTLYIIILILFAEKNSYLQSISRGLFNLNIVLGELKRKQKYYFGKNAIQSEDPLYETLIEQVQLMTKTGHQYQKTQTQENNLLTKAQMNMKQQFKESQLEFNYKRLTVLGVAHSPRRIYMFILGMAGLLSGTFRANLCTLARYSCRT